MKHAYMIMAHDNFFNLEILVKLLDNEQNSLYIHIDKKVKNFNFNFFRNISKKSKIFFVDRINIYWGTYTQIDAIKHLMIEAVTNNYDYYHMISGADLPINSQKEIHSFFGKNNGKEFIGYAKNFNNDLVYKYNFFVKYHRNNSKFISLNSKRIRKALNKLQEMLNINPVKNLDWEIKKGCDWYSLTHNAVNYILEEEDKFKKYFKYAMGPGEFFIQTIIYNSNFKNNIYNLDDENLGSLRFIDWERGKPYTFTNDDFELLINTELFFARKFDENIDKKIINNIYKKFKKGILK